MHYLWNLGLSVILPELILYCR